MIKPENGKWSLYTRDGGRRLGTYNTEAEALAREAQMARFAKAVPTGLMVALRLPDDVAAKVALPGGLPASELHCTLAYLGRVEDLPADAADRARVAAGKVAAEFGPFVGLLEGVGRFNASPTSDEDVLHAMLDAPVLDALRVRLVEALEAEGLKVAREHGFHPHITLRYEAPGASAELPRVATTAVVFQALAVVAGETETAVPLVGTRVLKGAPIDAPMFEAAKLKRNRLEKEISASAAQATEKQNMNHTLSKLWEFMSTDRDELRGRLERTQKELTAAEQVEVDAETEQIRVNRETPEGQKPHPFKAAEWTHPNGHPRCLTCGDEEPTSGTCAGAAVGDAVKKSAECFEQLLVAGVPPGAAQVRLGYELIAAGAEGYIAGALAREAAESVLKGRTHSREFLEEAYRLVQEKCPPWVVAAIRDSAKPRAGARARARRAEDARVAAPGVIERLALRGVQPGHLEDLDEGGLRGSWEKLREWHGAAKRRAEPVDEGLVVGAARHFMAEMKRRQLALEDDELVSAATPQGPGDGARVAKLLKARSRGQKQIVYGVVLDPYVVDAHNDWTPAADLEHTAHSWLEKYRDVPLWHLNDKGYRPLAATPVESWLEAYPSTEDYEAALRNEPHTVWRRQFGSDMVHSGTWIIGVRLPDDLWEMYQRGEIDAFSIQGFGVKRPTTRAAMPKVTVVDLVPAA